MSVTFNEAGLRELLDTEAGPVGILVAKLAAAIAEDAAVIGNAYYRGVVDLRGDITYDMVGSSAVVGYRPAGGSARKATRIASKEAAGVLTVPPLETAAKKARV